MLINIFQALGISFGINLLFFIIAYLIKKDVFTDITYASTFLIVTIVAMLINKTHSIQHIFALILIALWSFRLGSFLLIRIWRTKIDRRFNNMRNSFWKFGSFWFLQAITVWIVNMPAYFIMDSSYDNFSILSLIPFVFAILFLIFETIADLQKFNFNKSNHGKFINIGFWKTSRHPNYFGEYMFWLMFFVYLLVNKYDSYYLISSVGFIFIFVMLYFISGVPLLEKRDYQRFKKNKDYLFYIKKTPCVIPFIGKRGFIKGVKKHFNNEA